MSDPKTLHTYDFGRQAYDDEGNHYTQTDPGNAWDTTYRQDGDKDTEHDYFVEKRGDDGDVTASKGFPWDD